MHAEPALHQESLLFPLRRPIQERFEEFHQANPWVYRELVGMARRLQARGERMGINGLWEVLRYRSKLRPRSGEPFSFNDQFASRYARLIQEREPDLRGFFSLRELRAA